MNRELAELRKTAFAKWIRAQDRGVARTHLFECLKKGGPDNVAWNLWEYVHGDRNFSPDEINGALDAMVDALEEKCA